MRTRIGCLMAAVLVLAMAEVGESWAQASAATSVIPNVIVVPGGGLIYTITINDPTGAPMLLEPVDLVWPPATAALACFCAGTPLLFSAPTGAGGVITFNIAAGGCIDPAVTGTGVDVYAGGAYLTTVGQVSPDLVGAAGLPDCRVGLADAVALATPFQSGAYTFCADLNSDLAVGLADAALATRSIMLAAGCP